MDTVNRISDLKDALSRVENSNQPNIDIVISGKVFSSGPVIEGQPPIEELFSDAEFDELFSPQAILTMPSVDAINMTPEGQGSEDPLNQLFQPQRYLDTGVKPGYPSVDDGLCDLLEPQTLIGDGSTVPFPDPLLDKIGEIFDARFAQPMPQARMSSTLQMTDVGASTQIALNTESAAVPEYIPLREQMKRAVLDNTARIMQTYADAWAAHLAICDGSLDGGHGGITTSKDNWVAAYDASRSRINELMNDDRVKKALEKGDAAQAEAIIQKETLRVYGEQIGIDTTKLRNMSDELFRVSNPMEAMVMMQGALNHIGCACHSPAPGGGMGAMNMMPQYMPQMFLERMAMTTKKESHSHKHGVQYCGSCGWYGESCESEKCPKCNDKKWIKEADHKKLIKTKGE